MNLVNQNSCLSSSSCSVAPRSRFDDAEYLEEMHREISKPLSAVLGFSYILANVDCSQEKKQECIARLHESSEMLMSLIKNLLEPSNPDVVADEMLEEI
ncbi:MAG: hypothetical protein EBR02_00580 [Alphaproteobacteria bacterium]|nr:hypothetical protein [Alphaproteobacteria bacterium]